MAQLPCPGSLLCHAGGGKLVVPSDAAQQELLEELGGQIVGINRFLRPGYDSHSISRLTGYLVDDNALLTSLPQPLLQDDLVDPRYSHSFAHNYYRTATGRLWHVENHGRYGLCFVRVGYSPWIYSSVTIVLSWDELLILHVRTFTVGERPVAYSNESTTDHHHTRKSVDQLRDDLSHILQRSSDPEENERTVMAEPRSTPPVEVQEASQNGKRVVPPKRHDITTTRVPINLHPDLTIDEICEHHPTDLKGGCLLRTYELHGQTGRDDKTAGAGNSKGFHGQLVAKLYSYHPEGFGHWTLPDSSENRRLLETTFRKGVQMAKKGEVLYEAKARGRRPRCDRCRELHVECQYRADSDTGLPCEGCVNHGLAALCFVPPPPPPQLNALVTQDDVQAPLKDYTVQTDIAANYHIRRAQPLHKPSRNFPLTVDAESNLDRTVHSSTTKARQNATQSNIVEQPAVTQLNGSSAVRIGLTSPQLVIANDQEHADDDTWRNTDVMMCQLAHEYVEHGGFLDSATNAP